jgi:hypothetical protein
MSFPRFLIIGAALAGMVVVPQTGAAQGRPSVSLTAGISEYDLSGTGDTLFVALRAQFPLNSFLLVEPGLGYMKYVTQGGDARTHWFPEVQLQAELSIRRVRPYLGAGIGASYVSQDGQNETELTLSGAGGVRVDVGAGWGAGGELRVRAVDPWTGTTADFGLAVRRRL